MPIEQKQDPRKFAIHIQLTVYVPSESGEMMDKIITEQTLGITENTMPSKIMGAFKPQLIDTLQEARKHKTSSIIGVSTPKLIIAGE